MSESAQTDPRIRRAGLSVTEPQPVASRDETTGVLKICGSPQNGHRRQWPVDGPSGYINPYPGKLGVVEEGAFADLLLVEGDPIANIKLIEDPGKNFLVIMKDGKVYKNLLSH